VVFGPKNVRRAPGDAGNLKRVTEMVHEVETDSFVQRNGLVTPWPDSMHIVVSSFFFFASVNRSDLTPPF